jgi:hypothetical protein
MTPGVKFLAVYLTALDIFPGSSRDHDAQVSKASQPMMSIKVTCQAASAIHRPGCILKGERSTRLFKSSRY